MKKSIIIFAAFSWTGVLFSQTDCSDLFISEYVEGSYNNKSVELYNPTSDTLILDNSYRMIRWANGSVTSDTDPSYVLPLTGSIGPDRTWVIIQDTLPQGQDTMIWPSLRAKADWLAPYDFGGSIPGGSVVFWNGDDAISLQKLQINGTWKDIDIFGEIGVRPLNHDTTFSPAGGWTDSAPYCRGNGNYLTSDKTLIRKHTVMHGIDKITMLHYGDSVTGGFQHSFNALTEYDSLPVNFFDSLGGHACDCSLYVGVDHGKAAGFHDIMQLYPNPAGHWLIVELTSFRADPCSRLELFSPDGQLITTVPITGRLNRLDVSLLKKGLYILKSTAQDRIEVKRFIRK